MPSEIKVGRMVWIGRVISALAMVPFVFSASMKFSGSPQMLEGWSHMGWDPAMLTGIAILEVTCIVAYLIPRTAILGAILLTGYLGGAIATHLRLGEAAWLQFVFGVMIWAGLFFREPRLRAILPIRRP